MGNDTYGSGLELKDWRMLRDAVLGAVPKAEGPCEYYEVLPERLKRHRVGVLVHRFLKTGDPNAMAEAEKLLVPQEKGRHLALIKT